MSLIWVYMFSVVSEDICPMIVVLQDSNLPRFRSPPFRLRLCVHFCKALALLQISRFAKRHNKRSRRKPAPDIKPYQDKKASIHKVKSLMNTRYGAGGRNRNGTVSLPVDFELFASYGIQTNSNPYGGRQRTPKSPQLLIILKLMC